MNKLLFFLGIIFYTLSTNAQVCGTCSINITGLDSSQYTVDVGQTLCIDTTGNLIGNVVLNGGTICNKGLFHPKTMSFTSGTLNNSSNTSMQINLIIGSGGYINNLPGGILSITGSVSLSGGSLSNEGILNITASITNTSGTLSNSSIINCSQISGGNSITNDGVINKN